MLDLVASTVVHHLLLLSALLRLEGGQQGDGSRYLLGVLEVGGCCIYRRRVLGGVGGNVGDRGGVEVD